MTQSTKRTEPSDSVITKMSGKQCAENIIVTLEHIGMTDEQVVNFCRQLIETLQKKVDKCKS